MYSIHNNELALFCFELFFDCVCDEFWCVFYLIGDYVSELIACVLLWSNTEILCCGIISSVFIMLFRLDSFIILRHGINNLTSVFFHQIIYFKY